MLYFFGRHRSLVKLDFLAGDKIKSKWENQGGAGNDIGMILNFERLRSTHQVHISLNKANVVKNEIEILFSFSFSFCVYVYMCVYIYVCVCTCIYTYVYICIFFELLLSY